MGKCKRDNSHNSDQDDDIENILSKDQQGQVKELQDVGEHKWERRGCRCCWRVGYVGQCHKG